MSCRRDGGWRMEELFYSSARIGVSQLAARLTVNPETDDLLGRHRCGIITIPRAPSSLPCLAGTV